MSDNNQPPVYDARQREDESAFDYAQRIRKDIVHHKITTDGSLPTDPKEMAALNNILNGITASEIGMARIKVDEKQVDVAEEANRIYEAFGKRRIEMAQSLAFGQRGAGSKPVIDHFPGEEGFTTVPGETEIGVSSMNFKEFTESQGVEHKDK